MSNEGIRPIVCIRLNGLLVSRQANSPQSDRSTRYRGGVKKLLTMLRRHNCYIVLHTAMQLKHARLIVDRLLHETGITSDDYMLLSGEDTVIRHSPRDWEVINDLGMLLAPKLHEQKIKYRFDQFLVLDYKADILDKYRYVVYPIPEFAPGFKPDADDDLTQYTKSLDEMLTRIESQKISSVVEALNRDLPPTVLKDIMADSL